MKAIFVVSTIIACWLSAVAICHELFVPAFLALTFAVALLIEGGAADYEQYEN